MIPVLLTVEAGIFYALAGLGAGGRTVLAVEMLWLVVAILLAHLFASCTTSIMGADNYGSDDSGD